MSSLLVFLLLLGAVFGSFQPEHEFEVKQASLFNRGRSYTITEVGKTAKTDPNRFTIQNDLLSAGKKLVLLDNGQALYEIKHKLFHLYQKWNLYDAKTGETIGTLRHRPSILHDSYRFRSSKYGTYRITGHIGGQTFSIKKDGRQVAEIHKKPLHLHDTYIVQLEANQDPALMILLTIGVDEIRHH